VTGNIGTDATVAIADLTVQGGATGIRVADDANLGTIRLDGVVIRDNANHGFITNNGGSNPSTVANVVIENAVFEGNGFGNGSADINLFLFNGNATLRNVDILGTRSTDVASATDYGLQIRGNGRLLGATDTVQPSGSITLEDVRIAGTYKKAHLAIQDYSDLSGVSMTDVQLGGAVIGTVAGDVTESAAGWGAFFSSETKGTLNLGNTNFAGHSGSFDINLGNDTSGLEIDATGIRVEGVAVADMSTSELFDVEDRIAHKLDESPHALGFVRVKENQVYVTRNSGSIQRGINAADSGDVVNVQSGIYNENLTIDKALTLDGEGADTTKLASSNAGKGTGITISASNVTVQNLGISGYQNGAFLTGTIENVTFANLAFANNRYGVTFNKPDAKVDGFTMRDSTITGGTIGVSQDTNLGADNTPTSLLTNALFERVQISGASFQGMHFEAADNLVLTDVTVTDSGNVGYEDQDYNYGHGIDINLKFADYSSITFNNVVVENSGYSSGRSTGAAVVIKTRGGPGDSSSYTKRPATLQALNINGGRIEGSQGQGLRIEDLSNGEGGQPTVRIDGMRFADNGMDIVVAGKTNVDATGATFEGAADGFAIEDRVYHALDQAGLGLVTWDAGHIYVTQDSGSIQRGLDAADAGDTVHVGAGTFAENLSVTKDVTVVGAGTGITTINPASNTKSGSNPTPDSGWIVVGQDVEFNLSNVTLDGSGYQIYHGIFHQGHGTIDNVAFRNIQYNKYTGIAVRVLGGPTAGDVDVMNSTFENIGRIGVHFGNASTGSFIGNVYTGKGDGDHLDYAVEVGRGGKAVIRNNTITNNTGVAASDGSTSAGILVTTYYPPAGTQAIIENNFINGNAVGIKVGYDDNDQSVVTITGNDLSGNGKAIVSTNPVVDASYNWFGVTTPEAVQQLVEGPVQFTPFLTSGVDTSAAVGFQGNMAAIFPLPEPPLPPNVDDVASKAPPIPPSVNTETPPPPPAPPSTPANVFKSDAPSNPFNQTFSLGGGNPPAPPAPPQGSQPQGDTAQAPSQPPQTPNNIEAPSGGVDPTGPSDVGGDLNETNPGAEEATQFANNLLNNFSVGGGNSGSNDNADNGSNDNSNNSSNNTGNAGESGESGQK